MDMKKLFMAAVALIVLAACGGNAVVDTSVKDAVAEKKDVYELGAEIYNDAAEKLRNVKSESEIEDIETEFQKALDALENSAEMVEYIACVNSGDSIARQQYEASRKKLEDAAATYSSVLLDAYIRCSK